MKTIQQLAGEIAQIRVAQKFAEGNGSTPDAFPKDVETLTEAVLAFVTKFGMPADAESVKPSAKAQRKRTEAKSERSAKVSPEAMLDAVRLFGPASVATLANNLKVSKGVAERALKALGDRVKAEKGESNGPGKPPTVYSLV